MRNVSDSKVDRATALLALDRANQIDGTELEALRWYLYDFASLMTVMVTEWKVGGRKRERHGDTVLSTVFPKAVLRYVEKYQER